MIRVRCDKCERMLEAPPDLAGKKIACPACGDVKVLPGHPVVAAVPIAAAVPVAAAGASDRASQAGFPPDSGPEQRVLLVRPAMFRSNPGIALLVLGVVLGAIAGLVYFGAVRKHPTGLWGSAAALGLGLAVLGIWKIRHLSSKLEITNKRTIARRGLVSKATTEVLHDHVRNVQITQSVWKRLLGIGRVGLSSSADDSVEIVMDNLPSPDRVRRIIDLYRPM